MKNLIIILFLMPLSCVAQVQISTNNLNISFDKVKHIVLPARANSLSVGSEEMIHAEIVNDAEHIVCVSAVVEHFNETTNLTIICADGNVYSYRIFYNEKDTFNIFYPAGNTISNNEYFVQVNDKNTSHLFFPDDIIYAKQGNEETIHLDQQNNLVMLSTLYSSFPETNLFVVDKKNNTYNISVKNGLSESYVYNFISKGEIRDYVAKVGINEIEMNTLLKQALAKKRKIYTVGVRKDKFGFDLSNVLINQDMLFFVFDMRNESNIDFDIDFIKCFFVDKKTTKKEAIQINPIDYIYQSNFQNKIAARKKNRFVLVFNKFTIPDSKTFRVELYEKGGGRHITFDVNNTTVINAEELFISDF